MVVVLLVLDVQLVVVLLVLVVELVIVLLVFFFPVQTPLIMLWGEISVFRLYLPSHHLTACYLLIIPSALLNSLFYCNFNSWFFPIHKLLKSIDSKRTKCIKPESQQEKLPNLNKRRSGTFYGRHLAAIQYFQHNSNLC